MIDRRARILAIVILLASARYAHGDVVTPDLGAPVHLRTPSTTTTEGGSVLTLPPGYYLAEPLWLDRETKIKALQDATTRLDAENKSLRESTSGWQPGWKTIATALVVGFAGGVYAAYKVGH